MTIASVRLRNSVEVPQLALGALYLMPEDTRGLVEVALEAGYRHLNVEAGQGNEEGVGAALAASEMPREDYFVSAKLHDGAASHDATLDAFESVLQRLDLDHVDLLLLARPDSGRFVDAWRALEEIHREEATRAIGVANFGVEDLERLDREAAALPMVNQVELHPWLQRAELCARHAEWGIVTEAWSPLAQRALLDEQTLVRIAESHGRTPAQVAMRWHVQLGNVAIPKSVTAEQIRELADSFDFELTDDETAAIGNMERGAGIGPDTAEVALP